MRFPAVLIVAALAVPSALEAQSLRGQLTDSVTRAPLPGAFLTLVDEHGVEKARTITNGSGEFLLTAPAAGVYRLRSKRIGFRPYVSPPLTLSAGGTSSYNAVIDPIPVALSQVVVQGERQCDVEAGASVAAVWEEVYEALAAVSWTSRDPGYWYAITRFERETTPGGRARAPDSTWRDDGYRRVPIKSVPPPQLEREGFVVVDSDGWTYHGPDADELIRDKVRSRRNRRAHRTLVHTGPRPHAAGHYGHALDRPADGDAASPRLHVRTPAGGLVRSARRRSYRVPAGSLRRLDCARLGNPDARGADEAAADGDGNTGGGRWIQGSRRQRARDQDAGRDNRLPLRHDRRGARIRATRGGAPRARASIARSWIGRTSPRLGAGPRPRH